MNERDETILKKIMKYCDQVRAANEHFHYDRLLFMDEEQGIVYRNAVTMPILQIGELSKNLSKEFVSERRNIPWKSMARMRDVIAHHYSGLDKEATYETATADLPNLREQIIGMLETGSEANGT